MGRVLVILGLFPGLLFAQPSIQITRSNNIEAWCYSPDGTELTRHASAEKARESCANFALANPGYEYVVKSEFRIRAAVPDRPPPEDDPPEHPGPPVLSPVDECGAMCVKLSWSPPVEYTDGTPLTVAEYRLYWRRGAEVEYRSYGSVGMVTALSLGISQSGTYFFAVTAVDSDGLESIKSNEASKVIAN